MFQNTPMGYMAIAITLGFFSVLGALLFFNVDPSMKDPVMLMLGALIGNFGNVVAYYFGTTNTSAKKDQTIQDLTKTAVVAATTASAVQVASDVAVADAKASAKDAGDVTVVGENVTVQESSNVERKIP
jgi:hypothetical protein